MPSHLLAGELLVMRIHRHWVILARALVPPGALLAALAGLDLIAAIPSDLRITATLIGVALAGAGAIAAWMRWTSVTYTLTDRRVILESGILARHSKVIPLDRVQDVATRQSVAGRLLRYGNVEIDAAGPSGAAILETVDSPAAVRDELFEQAGRLRAPVRGAGE